MDLGFHPAPKPSYNRKVKKRASRSKFSKMVRDEIKEKYNNQCAICLRRACHVHHVLPRSRGGRNVITNGLLLCNNCHKEVHADNELLKYWINEFKKKYGSLFFMDREDIEYKQLTQELKKEDKQLKEWEKYNGKIQH
jgi:hypothetical protein